MNALKFGAVVQLANLGSEGLQKVSDAYAAKYPTDLVGVLPHQNILLTNDHLKLMLAVNAVAPDTTKINFIA